MTLVGCDLHPRKQRVAVDFRKAVENIAGRVALTFLEQELVHEGDAVERFYLALTPPVTIGIEATAYSQWFHALMHGLGHTVLVGEAGKIRAMVVRKTKTDRRDARHLLDLLKHERLPSVWMPDPRTRDLRAPIAHRVRLVRMRTMVKNGLQAIALNHRLALHAKLMGQSLPRAHQAMGHFQGLLTVEQERELVRLRDIHRQGYRAIRDVAFLLLCAAFLAGSVWSFIVLLRNPPADWLTLLILGSIAFASGIVALVARIIGRARRSRRVRRICRKFDVSSPTPGEEGALIRASMMTTSLQSATSERTGTRESAASPRPGIVGPVAVRHHNPV